MVSIVSPMLPKINEARLEAAARAILIAAAVLSRSIGLRMF
jgi:hypothetical protein